MKELPLACSLDAAALSARQSQLRTSVLADAHTVERLADGYRWWFAGAGDTLTRLGPLIDMERRCCRFLRFCLTADPDLGKITLDVTGPAGTTEILESWLTQPAI